LRISATIFLQRLGNYIQDSKRAVSYLVFNINADDHIIGEDSDNPFYCISAVLRLQAMGRNVLAKVQARL